MRPPPAAMGSLSKSSSWVLLPSGVLSEQMSVGSVSMFGEVSLSRIGCTCGTGEQLEGERLRLASHSRSINERTEGLAEREVELEGRGEALEDGEKGLLDGERTLREKVAGVGGRMEEAQQQLQEAVSYGQVVGTCEDELSQMATKLEELEIEAVARETAVAQEELLLIEDRNQVEEGLESLRSELFALEQQAEALRRDLEASDHLLEDSRREHTLLGSDAEILDEIERQVEPIQCALLEREERLAEGQADLVAREADCEEREAQLEPELSCAAEAWASAELRLLELRGREEEGERQRTRLLQRARDLGGTEVQLSGLEGAVQLQQGGVVGPGGPGAEDAPRRLAQLRAGDAAWQERLRAQQAEVQRLEAVVEALGSGAAAGPAELKKPQVPLKRLDAGAPSHRLVTAGFGAA